MDIRIFLDSKLNHNSALEYKICRCTQLAAFYPIPNNHSFDLTFCKKIIDITKCKLDNFFQSDLDVIALCVKRYCIALDAVFHDYHADF